MEKVNWPQLLLGFLFSIAATFVVLMLIQHKQYDAAGRPIGSTKPSLNTGGGRKNKGKRNRNGQPQMEAA